MNPPAILRRGVYAITDCERLPFSEVLERSAVLLGCGVAALQYRDKNTAPELRRERAAALHKLCGEHGVPFIINDDPGLAATLGAAGVHLGRDDPDYATARNILGPDSLIGVSCYDDLGAAQRAEATGADYVAFGAFFPTQTKHPQASAKAELLTAAKQLLRIPVVAIGGITPENAAGLLDAGADLLAVVGALYGAADPADVMQAFNAAFTKIDQRTTR